jgi:hypothetical protein
MKLKLLTSSLVLLSTVVSAVPDRPVIDRTIHMAEGHVSGGDDRHWLNPYVPPLTTSADARIGLVHRPFQGVFFRLIKPEKINQPFVESPAGMEIMNSTEIYDPAYEGITNPSSDIPSRSNQGHMTICDPSGDFEELTGNTNESPYACGDTGADDCYDLAVITQLDNSQLASTHVHVRVANPKTVDANIVEITTGDTIAGGTAFSGGAFFEPTMTGDSNLMLSRTDSNSSPSLSDIVYFHGDNVDAFPTCDVRKFTRRENIGHAPYDETINTRYGFAMQPFETLDNQGNRYVLPDNARFGTYPWIDKKGSNITFTSFGQRLSRAGFPTRCPLEVEAEYNANCSASAELAKVNGRTLMGLWTKGKMVLLDNMINHMDHIEDVRETGHRDVLIYNPTNDINDGYKRVGDTRSRTIDVMPNGNVTNTSFFDSNEHRFNYHSNMRPVSPADVTWLMSTGRSTDEVTFDDYLNVNGFIVSHMVQALRFNAQYNVRDILANHIQNSATSLAWNKPNSARMTGNGARAEIIASGGFTGKGYWLDGTNIALEYNIPAQANNNAVLNSPWYYSIFIDSRNNSGERTLMTFPDGSEIRLRNSNNIVFVNAAGTAVHTVNTLTNIPQTGWAHLGFQLSPSNRTVETYVNGFKVDSFTHNQALFVMSAGTLYLGANGDNRATFTGWIDDFKVLAEDVNKEIACNLAKGTLARVANNNTWNNVANLHAAPLHNEISNVLGNGSNSDRFVCYHDYSDDYAAHLQNVPNGLVGIRDDIHFPEGPLFQNRPRPESRQNAFCLTCHTADGQGGLDLDALAFDGNTLAPVDPRRQPMQPDPVVYGNIPANWLGQGLPATSFVANTVNGYRIDELLLPVARSGAGNGGTDSGTDSGTDTGTDPAPETNNVLINSSFESGDTAWNTPGSASVINNNQADGDSAAFIDGAGSFTQNVTLLPNTEYTLTVSGKVGEIGQSFWIGVSNATEGGFITNMTFTGTEYVSQSFTFETTANANHSYQIWMWNNQGGQYYADSFVLTTTENTTEEPDSLPDTTPEPLPETTPDPVPEATGEPVELATADTFVAASSNWQADRIVRVYDDNMAVEARANSNGLGTDLVWQEYSFDTASHFEFSVSEDNAPSYQISAWKVQAWNDASADWVDMMPWQNAAVNGWTNYTPATSLSADRIRVLFEAATTQRVGLREFNVSGIVHE